jgi:hypothetical protein
MDSEANTQNNKSQPADDAPVPAPVQAKDQTILSANEKEPSREQPNITINLPPNGTRHVEWTQVAINGALAVIGVVAICIYGCQLKVMQGQLQLTRQQFVGTEAAFVQMGAGIDNDLRTVEVGGSNGGHVDATDIRARVVLTEKDIRNGQTIGKPVTICDDLYKPKLTGSPGFDSVIDQKYYPSNLPHDAESVVRGKSWLELRTDYSYGDGFGKTIREWSCSAFIPVNNPSKDNPWRRVQCDEAPFHIKEYEAEKAKHTN